MSLTLRESFLKGRFADGESLYLRVPERIENKYEKAVALHLQRNTYGLKQVAIAS
jgi:hypothetical protein